MPDEPPQDSPATPPPPAPEHGTPAHHHGRPELPPIKFLEELKRRNVGRVAILYIVVGYVALEVFEVFFHLLEMPPWAGRVAVLVMVVGFPVVLIFAWAYEITPEGLKPTEEVSPKHSIRHQTGKRLDRAIIAVLAIALTYFVIDKFWLSKRAAPTVDHAAVAVKAAPTGAAVPEKSIAVLPFVDMSEKHDQEYFSDGLSEELIDHLAHIPDLKVIARTSAFAFKGKNEDMRSIAIKLGVANLLEGSVRKAGSELRITVQLIRASDGVHLWSEIYARKLNEIFKLQDEISTTVAKALNATLSSGKPSGIRSAPTGTPNVDAYNLMLKGNYFFFRGDKGDDALATKFYQDALHVDPEYATAWAKLARAYVWQATLGTLTAQDADAKTREAVFQALEADPNCAEAYFARGNMALQILGDWDAATADYERAVSLDANGTAGDDARGNVLALKADLYGQFGDAMNWTSRRLERNPLDTPNMFSLSVYERFTGRPEKAAATLRMLLEIDPNVMGANAELGFNLLLMGKKVEALAATEKEPDRQSKLESLVCIYWAMGRRAESDSALVALEKEFGNTGAYDIASMHAYRGEADAAFAWLDRADHQAKGVMLGLKYDPTFLSLRGDTRFKEVLRKEKLLR